MSSSFIGLRGFPGAGPGGPSGSSSGKEAYVGRGDIVLTVPGTYEITVPEYVTSASFLAIGAGGGSLYNNSTTTYVSSGGAGGLAFKNDVSVSPGEKFTVVVGRGGDCLSTNAATPGAAGAGGESYVKDTLTCRASGGVGGTKNINVNGGAMTAGDGGGSGGKGAEISTTGSTAFASGGAAAGYMGNGGDGVASLSQTALGGNAGTGGGGGSGNPGAPSGSVGLYGLGANGAGGTSGNAPATVAATGKGGSGGADGRLNNSRNAGLTPIGAGGSIFFSSVVDIANGGDGAVRIVWGVGRAFPSTDVGMG